MQSKCSGLILDDLQGGKLTHYMVAAEGGPIADHSAQYLRELFCEIVYLSSETYLSTVPYFPSMRRFSAETLLLRLFF